MTMPPPPPDRMHLQYQAAPPPQPGPQQMGPGGAYGPMQQSPAQPVPGQLPPPGMSMNKPGTITGIQVILWILLAISAIANLFSVISMVEFFNPLSLIGLAFAVYSTIQSLASGVHISRGKRWAWIWSLISSIIGLVMATAAMIFGLIYVDNGGWVTLLIGIALAGLYGTLLGLLSSKSARAWILMHRIQRGEVQVPGMAMGGMPGTAQQGPAAAPERPENRPMSATIAAVALGLLSALLAWESYQIVSNTLEGMRMAEANGFDGGDDLYGRLFFGAFPQLGHIMVAYLAFLLCAILTGLLVLKGKLGGRVFGLIWSPIAAAALGYVTSYFYELSSRFPPGPINPYRTILILNGSMAILAVAVFVLLLTPGVRAWTPSKPSTPLIMMVPMGQPQQPGPYGQQQGGYPQQQQPQQGYQQQQPPYPPQY